MPKGKPIGWIPIKKVNPPLAHIGYYYSNESSYLPVRDVRKRWDSKADPNIETGTYGLCSTCMPAARKNIVLRGDSFLFHYTNWKGARRFTGYYDLGWYVITGFRVRNREGGFYNFLDYALKAKSMHFVKDGIILDGPQWSKISSNYVSDKKVKGYGPREYKAIDTKLTLLLKKLLDKQPDITQEYIKEIHKLEDENLSNTEYRYPSWEMVNRFDDKLLEEFVK